MTRVTAAPPMSFFERARPADGDRGVGIELGSVRIQIEGLGDELASALHERYSPYSVPARREDGALKVRLGLEDREYFIDPPHKAEPNRVILACDGPRVRYLGYRVAGWFDTADGRGEVLLARGEFEPALSALENYVRAAVAWQAAGRGGALIHAASAVWNGRGYLFYGESGAGKSTLSAANTRARVVSDDLSLVLPGNEGTLELIGSPFRGTYEGGEPVQGAFPLAAGFRIIKDTRADVRPVARSRAMAELVGNLPFVAEAFSKRPDLFASVHRAFSRIALAHLHFARDDTYWDAIERAEL